MIFITLTVINCEIGIEIKYFIFKSMKLPLFFLLKYNILLEKINLQLETKNLQKEINLTMRIN